MAKIAQKTKTTFRIDPDIFKEFNDLIKELGLRRDTYLNNVLWGDLYYLNNVPANSSKAGKFYKAIRDIQDPRLKRVGITLDNDLIEKINSICKAKRFPRDAFLERFLIYLTTGPDAGEGEGPSPLHRARDLISDPRSEFIMCNEDLPYDFLCIAGTDKETQELFNDLIKKWKSE